VRTRRSATWCTGGGLVERRQRPISHKYEVDLAVEEIGLDLAVRYCIPCVGAAGQVEEEGRLEELASGQDGDPLDIIVRNG
jgi:hypothetical protein